MIHDTTADMSASAGASAHRREWKAFWLLLLFACLIMIPFLGLADYHTKGEPREAVVTYSMLATDNWVLPTNNGGDIPYKPPFFHWTIGVASVLTGGAVTEFSSRLPSALALIAMTMMTFMFFMRRKGLTTGLLTALVTLSAFELHRAGANTRVDMMLTALTVCSLYLLYRWWEKDLKGVPWLAILLMSLATLTKGPVGSVIPCLAFGVFLLLEGVNFFKAFFYLLLCGLASFIIPLCWYYAAYLQRGDAFLDLVMEENFGRMTSTMSYDSCVNPWYYNFITLVGGYVPWILLVLLSLFTISYKPLKRSFRDTSTRVREAYASHNPVNLFALVCIVVIFVFYCIPQSKRSVYLMPIYPFIAYFLAQYMLYLVREHSKALKIYGWILAVASLLLTAVFVAVKCGAVPDTIFHGKRAAQNVAMLHALMNVGGWSWLLIAIPPLLSVGWIAYVRRHRSYGPGLLYAICALTFGLYVALDGAYQPPVLNAKSVRPVAEEIDAVAPASSGTLYEFIEMGEFAAGDPVHFFEIDFYLGDRVQNFRRNHPKDGYLMILQEDAERWLPEFEKDGYSFTDVYTSSRPVNRCTLKVYRFTRADDAAEEPAAAPAVEVAAGAAAK